MSKKKKKKIVNKKDTQSTESKVVDKKDKQSTKSKYKRGNLGKAIYQYFDKVDVDKATFDETMKLAKSILPTTKFDRYHFSWYKNKYRQNQS